MIRFGVRARSIGPVLLAIGFGIAVGSSPEAFGAGVERSVLLSPAEVAASIPGANFVRVSAALLGSGGSVAIPVQWDELAFPDILVRDELWVIHPGEPVRTLVPYDWVPPGSPEEERREAIHPIGVDPTGSVLVKVTTTSTHGLWWFDRDGAAREVVRAGDLLGEPDGAWVKWVSTYPDMAPDGSFLAIVDLEGPEVGTLNSRGLWMGGPEGTIERIARDGDVVPGLAYEAFFNQMPSAILPNASGEMALVGLTRRLGESDALLWRRSAEGVWQVVAQAGDPTPGRPPPSFYGDFFPSSIGATGQILFTAREDPFTSGLFRTELDGSITKLLYSGDPAPGLPEGTTFRWVGGSMNASGEIVVNARIAGPGITTANDETVWRLLRNGSLRLLFRENHPFGDDGRTIYNLGTASIHAHGDVLLEAWTSPNLGWTILVAPANGPVIEVAAGGSGTELETDGLRREALAVWVARMNDRREITFVASFAGSGHEPVVARLPEPAGLGTLATAALAWLRRNRGSRA